MRNLNVTQANKIQLIKSLLERNTITFSNIKSNYSIVKNNNDQILHFIGTNSVVIKLQNAEGASFALKILFEPKQFETYKLLAQQDKTEESYIPQVIILEKEIIVKNYDTSVEYFDAVLMPWLEGITLKEKLIELTIESKNAEILKLYKSFSNFVADLKKYNFNHGDINDTNIIVSNDYKFNLIDFDNYSSESFPFLAEDANCNKNFTHPDYKEFLNSKDADDFSLLVIATSLYTYSLMPNLYTDLYTYSSLLFTRKDFENVETSTVFDFLHSLNNDFLDILVNQIKISLLNRSPKINNLENLLQLDEKLHSEFKKIKEKEYLETKIDFKDEYIEVLEDKYHNQIRNYNSKEIITEKLSDEKVVLHKKYFNLKTTSRVYMSVLALVSLTMLSYLFTSNVKSKSKHFEMAKTFSIDPALLAVATTPATKDIVPFEKLNNAEQDAIEIKSNKNTTFTKSEVAQNFEKNNLNKPIKLKPIEKIVTKVTPSVTFKEIDFSK